ncbi:MAG: ABC transporter ATP-binding protein [Thermoleophilia bacterium]
MEPGTALGIVGANTAGKSTMLKLIAGILPPDSGVVRTGGRVVSLLELGAGFHPDFSGRENVILNASIHGISRRDIAAKMDRIGFSELEGFIDAPVRTYSSGMYARLGFSVAAELNPDILLLDEILAVGDAAFQSKCLSRIAEFQPGRDHLFRQPRRLRRGAGVRPRLLAVRQARAARRRHVGGAGRLPPAAERRGQGGRPCGGRGAWKLARIASLRSHSEGVASDRFVAMQPFAVDVEVEVESPTGFLVELRIRTVDGYVLTSSPTAPSRPPREPAATNPNTASP